MRVPSSSGLIQTTGWPGDARESLVASEIITAVCASRNGKDARGAAKRALGRTLMLCMTTVCIVLAVYC